MSGAEQASLMKPGTRVVRGPDWKWGDQDGNPPTVGAVAGTYRLSSGWIPVKWKSGGLRNYRYVPVLLKFLHTIIHQFNSGVNDRHCLYIHVYIIQI